MLEHILERIDKVNIHKHKFEILAVTKTRSVDEIKPLLAQGIQLIGENRIQEAMQKFPLLTEEKIEKHLIGPLQSNKENNALELFDVIQSIESLAQLERLSKKLAQKNLQKKIYIQFNSALEDTKHGLREESDIYPLLDFLEENSTLQLQGLMTIGAMSDDEKSVRQSFSRLANIKENLIIKYPKFKHLKLSMGMSGDFEWAIQEGSNLIRLGTILFTKKER